MKPDGSKGRQVKAKGTADGLSSGRQEDCHDLTPRSRKSSLWTTGETKDRGTYLTFKMNDTPLMVGRAYHIRDESENGFVGVGILKDINPPAYPTGTFGFTLLDDPDGINYGVFARDCIGEVAQRQDSLSDQLRDLLRFATQLRMYDAADWLEAKMRKE